MVIIRMTGGLGNQMFQYALYLQLKSQGKDVKFDDKTEYEGRDARPIQLWSFDINYPRASRQEIDQITDGFMRLSCRIRRKLLGRRSMEYQEKRDCFDPRVLEKDPAYLCGYFQSESYFKDVKEQVRNEFTFSEQIWKGISEPLVKKIRCYQSKIENVTSVSVHIRRGDYLEKEQIYGGICSEAYYKKAISYFIEKMPDAVFIVFSNEPEWVKEWIGRICGDTDRFVVIEGTTEDTGYLDLFLMSRCKSHIIANSSFSWWGAWLNPDPGKTVIAPARWFADRVMEHIYTKEMLLVSSEGELCRK